MCLRDGTSISRVIGVTKIEKATESLLVMMYYRKNRIAGSAVLILSRHLPGIRKLMLRNLLAGCKAAMEANTF